MKESCVAVRDEVVPRVVTIIITGAVRALQGPRPPPSPAACALLRKEE